jgi:pimeloyl-ACP methyl ester carboxylesterase
MGSAPSARPVLAGVKAPALMIWGEHDVPSALPELPPSAQVMIIPGADHAGALEAIDVVLPAVLEFLANAMGEQ